MGIESGMNPDLMKAGKFTLSEAEKAGLRASIQKTEKKAPYKHKSSPERSLNSPKMKDIPVQKIDPELMKAGRFVLSEEEKANFHKLTEEAEISKIKEDIAEMDEKKSEDEEK